MTLLGLIAVGLVIGLTMGALGGGGSVLTVPALIYLFDQSPAAATTASLAIVGISAGAGVIGHARARRVKWKAGIAFGVIGIATALVGTRLSQSVNPDLLLAGFAALLVLAAGAMLHSGPEPDHDPDEDGPHAAAATSSTTAVKTRISALSQSRYLRLGGAALLVGFLTGFFGVGGGFVILPALVLALHFGMPEAVATSLLIIAVNSASGLAGRLGDAFHWDVIAPLSAAAVLGSLAGKRVTDRASESLLQRGFAAVLVALAVYIGTRSAINLT